MALTYNQSRESLEHVLTNVLELKSKYPIHKALIHNGYGCIEDLLNIYYTYIPDFSYITPTK